MGSRIIFTELAERGEYDEEFLDGKVHAAEMSCGDPSTVCGIYMVDGIAKTKDTRKPIDCSACLSALESRGVFKKRNGKWY